MSISVVARVEQLHKSGALKDKCGGAVDSGRKLALVSERPLEVVLGVTSGHAMCGLGFDLFAFAFFHALQ